MRPLVLAAGILSIATPLSAAGACFPNAVEKRVVIAGSAASSIESLLGLGPEGVSSVSLQLGRNDAWAVYLLKHDTKQEITNGDGPDRYNTAEFSAAPPSLSLGPYWLDLGTGAPDTRPGYFSFGSPFLSESLRSGDAWAKLVRRLQAEPGWNREAQPQFERCFTSPNRTEICIRIYGAKDYTNNVERNGYAVTLTAHQS